MHAMLYYAVGKLGDMAVALDIPKSMTREIVYENC